MFHQSGGCCDGSSPMCYPDGEFIVDDRDVLLAILNVGDGVPVWIGMRFLSRERAFSDAENQLLAGQPPVTGADYANGKQPPATGTHIVAEAVDACPIPAGRGVQP
jgi:hypothetical protein